MAASLFAQLHVLRDRIEATTDPAVNGDLYLEARTLFYAAEDAPEGVTELEREMWRTVITASMEQGRKLARPIEPLVVLG